jgi:L-iditol 2-dehydrogenase
MKVIRLHSAGDIRLHEEEIPRPLDGESLLQVTAVGICGSDVLWFQQGGIGETRLSSPLVLGHEFAAVTEAGRRVAVDPLINCGRCVQCLEGNPNFCEALVFAGHGRQDGALREFMAWPSRSCFPIPDTLSDADGAMLEPLGVALHSVDLAHLKHEMRVAVLGCGPIGLLILQLVRLFGVRHILATEVLPHRLEAARTLGATDILLAEPATPLVPAADDHMQADFDVVFEAAGANAAVETAVNIVRPGGIIILVGIPPDDRISFNASTARRKGITLKLVRRMKHTYPRAIQLVAEGLVDVRSLVTHRFPLERAGEAFSAAGRRDGIKIVIEMKLRTGKERENV